MLCRSVAEEFHNRVTVYVGRFDAGDMAAAGQHDELGSGDGVSDRLGLGGDVEARCLLIRVEDKWLMATVTPAFEGT